MIKFQSPQSSLALTGDESKNRSGTPPAIGAFPGTSLSMHSKRNTNVRSFPRYGLNYHRTLPAPNAASRRRLVLPGISEAATLDAIELSITNDTKASNGAAGFALVFAESDDLCLAALPLLHATPTQANNVTNSSVLSEIAEHLLRNFQSQFATTLASKKTEFMLEAKNSENAINNERFLDAFSSFSPFEK